MRLRAGLALIALTAVLPLAWARADVVIALAGPFTGDNAAIGEQMQQGAERAVADLNAAGGIAGETVVLRQFDDVCDPKQAVSVANRIVSDGIRFVVGHYCSAASIAASDVYADEDVVQIAPGSTNPLYTERGLPTTFRVCGRDDQQAAVAADYVAAHFPGWPVAITHDKTAPGKTLADVFDSTLHGHGIQPVMKEAINKGELDYSAIVTRMKELGARVLYHAAYHKEAGLIARQAKEADLNIQLVSNDDLNVPQFWSITGPAGEGALFTFEADARRTPEAAPVVAAFRAAGFEPTGYTLYTYAAVQIFAEVIARTGKDGGPAASDLMHSTSFPTVLGEIGFDEKGDVRNPAYRVYRWHDGDYDYAP